MHTMTSLSRTAGVNPSTIRTWERRYGVPNPIRAANGRRRYSDDDVRRVKLLAELVNAGAQIGDIVAFDEQKLVELLEEKQKNAPSVQLAQDPTLERLIAAIHTRDVYTIRREISSVISSRPPIEAIRDVFSPLMHGVGELWRNGELPVAMEHVVSASVKQCIYAASSIQGWDPNGTRFLFSTISDELHELGILFGWYLSVTERANSVYLGPNLPMQQLLASQDLFDADTIVLSAVNVDDLTRRAPEIRFLIDSVRPHVEIWIGSPAVTNPFPFEHPRLKTFSNYDSYFRELRLRTAPKKKSAR